jgi:hypothetical protein
MESTDSLNKALQERLVIEIGQTIKRHYEMRPELSRIAVYEVLQALAFHAAVVLHGTDMDPEAIDYFLRRLNELLNEETEANEPTTDNQY